MKKSTKFWLIMAGLIAGLALLAKIIGWIGITLLCAALGFAAGYVLGRRHQKSGD